MHHRKPGQDCAPQAPSVRGGISTPCRNRNSRAWRAAVPLSQGNDAVSLVPVRVSRHQEHPATSGSWRRAGDGPLGYIALCRKIELKQNATNQPGKGQAPSSRLASIGAAKENDNWIPPPKPCHPKDSNAVCQGGFKQNVCPRVPEHFGNMVWFRLTPGRG